MISYSKLVRSVRLNIFLKAKHSLNNLPSTGAEAAAVSETIKDNIRLGAKFISIAIKSRE